MKRVLISTAFLATIPAANWMIAHVGTVCPSHGPCLVPVWPWPAIYAPSGSVLMGVALVLRNMLQQHATRSWIFTCIVLGASISAMIAPASLTLASAAAFFLSEMADWSVYDPLKNRNLTLAILLAGSAGAVIDSTIFVTFAFGAALPLIGGQVVAKVWASLFAACALSLSGRMTAPNDRIAVE